MPLPALRDPEDWRRRLRGWACGLPAAMFLFTTLLLFNLAQTLSWPLHWLSASACRRLNRLIANTWWGWCVSISQWLHGVELVTSGDALPMREDAIVVANHQQMPDITFIMILARRHGRLGDLKWLVKDVVKYVPGVGWGMVFLDCLFVKRNWTADRATIERTFAKLTKNRVPVWLVSFPEGTRLTPAKLERSRAYATHLGVTPPRHTLVPRTKGFVASVRGLDAHIDAVYDLTVGYERGVPTLWQYVKGFARRAHIQPARARGSARVGPSGVLALRG